MRTVTELRQERATLVRGLRSIVAAAENQNRGLSAEETQEFERVEAAIGDLEERAQRLERASALEGDLEERAGGDGREFQGLSAGERRTVGERATEYRDAFEHYVRGGHDALDREMRSILSRGFVEERANQQLKGTGNVGGYLVPTTFQSRIVESLLQAGSIRRLPGVTPIVTGAGEDIKLPKSGSHAVAAWTAEVGA